MGVYRFPAPTGAGFQRSQPTRASSPESVIKKLNRIDVFMIVCFQARSRFPFEVGTPFQFAAVNLTRVDNADRDKCTFTIRGDTEGIFVNPLTGQVRHPHVLYAAFSFRSKVCCSIQRRSPLDMVFKLTEVGDRAVWRRYVAEVVWRRWCAMEVCDGCV